jgi:hypothetical protein
MYGMAQFYFYVTNVKQAKFFLANWLTTKQRSDVKPAWHDGLLSLTVPAQFKQVMADLWDPQVKESFEKNGLDSLYVTYPYVRASIKRQATTPPLPANKPDNV